MRTRLVLDASAALEAVLRRPGGVAVLDAVEGAHNVTAPGLFAAEVANALWKHVRAGDLEREDAQTALEEALQLVDSLTESRDLVSEALVAASAFDHPVYDTLYAVLARRTGAAVCTLDRRLKRLLDEMRVLSI
ncbi:MAG: type II toxin-antitoxin system VapC family toxin [Thermoanaerobaculales bacterium]|nr:type II toxin-antitoxin system VapC family toxin [Thermoanaerobaculales bacterium]